MLAAIKHGLGNLLNFHGRDARQAFWYYVLFVYIVTIAITLVVTVPMMISGFMTGIQQGIAAGQSGDPMAAQAATQTAMAGMMGDMMSTTLWMSIATGVLTLALLGAAFVRRLHDSDLTGWLALIPAGLQAINLVLVPTMMGHMIQNLGEMAPNDPTAGFRAMQGSFSMASLLGWGAIILVIVLGVRKSTPGPNRYGETPFNA